MIYNVLQLFHQLASSVSLLASLRREVPLSAPLMQMRQVESFQMPACNLRWHLSFLPQMLSPKLIHQVIFPIIQRHYFMSGKVIE